MNHVQSLNGRWSLTYAEGRSRSIPQCYRQPNHKPDWSMVAQVPEAVQQTLDRERIIPSPLHGSGSLHARWVEDVYWIYRTTFTVPEAVALARNRFLRLDCVDLAATAWLNGGELGSHMNANRPWFIDLGDRLQPGENTLVIQVTTGWQKVLDRPSAFWGTNLRSHARRQWLRRPQYTSGWDWNPQLINVGILGDVTLLCGDGPFLVQTGVRAVPTADLSRAQVSVRCHLLGEPAGPVTVAASLPAPDGSVAPRGAARATVAPEDLAADTHLGVPAFTTPPLVMELTQPDLWWPRGKGRQPMYTAQVEVRSADRAAREASAQTACVRFGVRRVAVDQSPHPDGGSYFTVAVNGVPTFCKGANWVPPTLYYADVDSERIDRLAAEAGEADMNMLRVWGGGTWAPVRLMDRCDELGILVWHDYLYACIDYPADDPEFLADATAEAVWGTRLLANHPSLVILAGNNEVAQNDPDRGAPGTPFDLLFTRRLAEIAATEAPETFYWPASPHSPRGTHPNDPTVGDQHPWGVTLGGYPSCRMEGSHTNFFAYRSHHDRFADEGGVLGTSTLPTLRRYLGEADTGLGTLSWRHHDNFHGGMDPEELGGLGTAPRVVREFSGRDPQTMPIEEYVALSMMLQSEGLEEYIRAYRRRMWDSSAAVFWMYNDSWPCSHSWTVHDYDLRRKLSYYGAKRAFAPVILVVAEEAGEARVYGVNDTMDSVVAWLDVGRAAPDSDGARSERVSVTLAPNASTLLARRDLPADEREIVFARLISGDVQLAQHALFRVKYHALGLSRPDVQISVRGSFLTIETDRPAWGICLDLDGAVSLSDNCVTAFPGFPYQIPWEGTATEAPTLVTTGNDLLIGG